MIFNSHREMDEVYLWWMINVWSTFDKCIVDMLVKFCEEAGEEN